MPKFADVVLTIPTSEGFTYRIPSALVDIMQPGMQVIVPFSRRVVAGIVLKVSDISPAGLDEGSIREIRDLVDPAPLISRELMNLLNWISEYYICHLGEAFRLVQSHIYVGKSRPTVQRLIDVLPEDLPEDQAESLSRIPFNRAVSLKSIQKKTINKSLYTNINDWEKKGWIKKDFSVIDRKKIFQTEDSYRREIASSELTEDQKKYLARIEKRKTKTWLVYEYLAEKEWVARPVLISAGFDGTALNNLEAKGLISRRTETLDRIVKSEYKERIEKIILNDEQRQIVEEIGKSFNQKQFQTVLLHGITGSGKTQVYIELIHEVLKKKRTVIVLIPEIILTPQTLARFQFYFPDKVGVIHSRLSVGEKREILYKIRSGHYPVVLGARSAIFAPLKNLGLIIVDEEHESSYKQSEAQPRYHARDVAIYRAKLNNALVVLGSATPSFESLYNVNQGHYDYFRLGKRIAARNLPRIAIIDLREEWKKGGDYPVVSESMELKIESRLLTREQIMVLQNRRGYSPYILCQECGFIAKCPNCELTLTYHQKAHSLICHYCRHRERAPDICPECHGMDILYRGVGTQRLEEVIRQKFTGVEILRMDQDTTRGKNAHLDLLEKFRSGEAEILLGTKMIAKGLDFEKVTLVGIISADQGLHFPDFRASEKVFQLLTQAAGRAGRGSSSGEVVVQTLDPSHFMFKYLMSHDYLSFFKKELQSRKNLKYPPFSRLILIRIEGKEESAVQKYGDSIVKFLWKANKDKRYVVLGPAPCPIYKIQNTYRYQILIKQEKQIDGSLSYVRRIIKETFLNKANIKKWPVKISIDVDPIEIL